MFNKLAIIFAIFLMPIFASAQDFNAKIAVVDVAKVMAESTAMKKADKEIKAKRDVYRKEISASEDKLKKAEGDLAKQKGVLSKEAMNNKQKEFYDEIRDAQKNVQVNTSKLDKALRTALSKVQVAIREIVAELAEEKDFQIALPTEPLIYTSNGLNITDEVISRLNEKLPSVELKF